MIQATVSIAFLALSLTARVRALECRQGPDASTQHCKHFVHT